MMRRMPSLWRLVPLLAAVLVSCAPVAQPPVAAGLSQCKRDSLETLYKGVFTFGTDQPVYPPWYMGDDPENGEGFESAVAYAVADKLGYPREDVRWVRVPFNAALAPGAKEFDASLSEFSITDQRKAAVDFSTPYFDVTQAVVTVKSSPAAASPQHRRAQAAAARCPGRHDQLYGGHLGGRRQPGCGLQHQRRREDGVE